MNRFLLVAVLSTVAMEAEAQGIVVGQRVRVTAQEPQLRGTTGMVQSLDGQAIAFGEGGKHWTVPIKQVTRLEVAQGKKGHVLPGLLIGIGAGFVAGMIAIEGGSSSQCSGSGNSYDDICRGIVAGATVLGAGLGAGIGALIKSDRWVPVPLETFPPATGVARGLGPLPAQETLVTGCRTAW